MRNLFAAMSLAAAMLSGAPALAQSTDAPPPPPAGGMRGSGGALLRADANGDGVVTRAEATAQADQQFDRLDLNKDGRITADERQAVRDQAMARRAARGGAPAADAPPPPPPPPPPGGKMGKRMDPDGDGAITRDEYRARALQRFDRLDTNHDGKIDATEIAAMRQRAMERRGEFGPAPAATPKP